MTLTREPLPVQTISLGDGTGRPRWFRRKRVWLLAGLGGLILVLLVLFGAPTPQDGSTYSRSPTGYRGWYDYMRQQNAPIQRWQKDYDQLTGTGQTLIQVWGKAPAKPMTRRELARVQRWIAEGNTLITLSWLDQETIPWLDEGCPLGYCWRGEVTVAPFSSQLKSDVGPVLIQTTRRHPLQSGDRPELTDAYGGVMWSNPEGEGRVIYATYPWIAANIFADQPGNYSFLAQLAQQTGGTIWMDEWVHGHRDPDPNAAANASQPEDLFGFLARTPVALLTAQGGLILLLLIWGQNHRFGAAQSLKVPTQDNSEQYIQALGAILNKAGQTGFVTSQLSQTLRQSLAAQLGLTQSHGDRSRLPQDNDLATQWAGVTGRPAQELLELLEQAGQTRRLSDRQLLDWVSKAESILRGLS